jgi:hypothetical protein
MKRNSNVRYLSYGLFIGSVLAVILMGATFIFVSGDIAALMAATQTVAVTPTMPQPTFAIIPADTQTFTPEPATITPTFTSTPTLTYLASPTVTDTPTSTATLTLGEQKVLNGELYFAGPLTHEQQIRLYETSITFIALTTRESIKVGEQITSKGFGSPTLICGPLSVAILQTSGILTTDVVPLDFWLLNPFVVKDRALLKRAFPEVQYEHHEVNTAINATDFSAFPLLPGDFIYLKHGSGGNFDHMLVVNRVDVLGRAYSVTNYNNPDAGFIIDEVMLYDPNDPATGIFKTWTKKRNAVEGSTGFGGFELWRRISQ